LYKSASIVDSDHLSGQWTTLVVSGPP